MATTPTILVKKADGSFVRMSLDEVKKIKSSAPTPMAPAPAAPVPAKPVKPMAAASPAPRPPSPPPVPERRAKPSAPAPEKKVTAGASTPPPAPVSKKLPKPVLTETEPVRPAQAAPPPLPAASATDFSSPLEEDLPEMKSAVLPRLSASRDQEVDTLIGKLSFTVSPEHQNRLRTIVQLRLKDIRDNDQTREVLVRRALDGGLGLTPEQADEVVNRCEEAVKPAPAPVRPPRSSVTSAPAPTAAARKNTIAIFYESSVPATTTPFNAFVHGQLKPQPAERPAAQPSSVSAAPSGKAASQKMATDVFKLNTTPAAKIPMHDIVSRPKILNPVEEIRFISSVDFRRLAPTIPEAVARLKQKFINLREESMVLFLEGWAAWKESPLYVDYVTAVAGLLARNQKIANLIADKKNLQPDEISALVDMEHSLSVV